MIWKRVPKATHVGLDVLYVGVYDAIAHFNNCEIAALDIMELLKVDPGYLSTCVVNVCPFIVCWNYRKNVGRCCVIPKTKAARQKH